MPNQAGTALPNGSAPAGTTINTSIAIDARGADAGVEVAITLEDGQVLEGRCDGPPGIWGRPVAPTVLAGKWQDCLAAALGEAAAARVLTLSGLSPLPVSGIMEATGLAISAYECMQSA